MKYFSFILYIATLHSVSSRIRHFTHHVHRKSYRPITSTIKEENPCHNGGTYSTVGLNEKVCVCPEKFMGTKCQEINYCSDKPCKNCGRCTVTPSYPHYTCECCKKYYGPQCQFENVCEPNPCGRFGKCEAIGKNWTCSCQPGFKGASCNVLDNCYPNPCKNDGKCVPTDAFGSIRCDCGGSKWTGALCNVPNACQSNPCQNGGQCEDRNGDFACTCIEGFTGKSCAETVCSPNPCQNEGTCIQNQRGEAQCVCPAYAKGARCEVISPCLMSPCKNNARCVDSRSGYTWPLRPMQYYCICKPPYVGRHCEQEPCSLCDINAFCTAGRCYCNLGYIGDGVVCRRRPDVCNPNPCYNEGTCIDKSDGTFLCVCKKSFHPPLCKVRDSCLPNPCNGGRCFPLPDGSFNCDCPQGFVGNKCEVKDPCAQAPCKNNGLCQRLEEEPDKYSCLCKGHWTGNLCEKCRCPKSTHVLTLPSYCDAVTGACKCPGESKYSKGNKICYNSLASRKSLVSVCLPNPCKHNGVCIPVDSSYDCKCPSRFTGPHCEVDKCLQCDENANCFAGECTCARGYVGNGYRCQRSCANQCLELQFCSERGTCQCIPGYYMVGVQCVQINDYSFKEPVWNTPRPFTRDDEDMAETTSKPSKPHRPTTRPTPISRSSRTTPHKTTHHKKTTQHSSRPSTRLSTVSPSTIPPEITNENSIKPPGLPPTNPTPSGSIGPPGILDNTNDGEIGPPGTRREVPGKFVINVESENLDKNNNAQVTVDDGNMMMPSLANDTAENSMKRENLTKKPTADKIILNGTYVKVEKKLPKDSNDKNVSRTTKLKSANSTLKNYSTGHENIDEKNANFKNNVNNQSKTENYVGDHLERFQVENFHPTQPITIKYHNLSNQNQNEKLLKYVDEINDDISKNISEVRNIIKSLDESSSTFEDANNIFSVHDKPELNKSRDTSVVEIISSHKQNSTNGVLQTKTSITSRDDGSTTQKNSPENKKNETNSKNKNMQNQSNHSKDLQSRDKYNQSSITKQNKPKQVEILSNQTSSKAKTKEIVSKTSSSESSQSNGGVRKRKISKAAGVRAKVVIEDDAKKSTVGNSKKQNKTKTKQDAINKKTDTGGDVSKETLLQLFLAKNAPIQSFAKESKNTSKSSTNKKAKPRDTKKTNKSKNNTKQKSRIVNENETKRSLAVDKNHADRSLKSVQEYLSKQSTNGNTESQSRDQTKERKISEVNIRQKSKISLEEEIKKISLDNSTGFVKYTNSTTQVKTDQESRDQNDEKVNKSEIPKSFTHSQNIVADVLQKRKLSREELKSPVNKHAHNQSRDSARHQSRDSAHNHSLDSAHNQSRDSAQNHSRDSSHHQSRDSAHHQSRDSHSNGHKLNEKLQANKAHSAKTVDIHLKEHEKTKPIDLNFNTGSISQNRKVSNSGRKHSNIVNEDEGSEINKIQDDEKLEDRSKSAHPKRRTLDKPSNDTDDLEFFENNLDNYEAIWDKLNNTKAEAPLSNTGIKNTSVTSSKRQSLGSNKIYTVKESTSSVFPHLVDYEDTDEALSNQSSDSESLESKLKSQKASTISDDVTLEQGTNQNGFMRNDRSLQGYIDEKD